MKIQLQPNVINDITALATIADGDNATVEFLSGGTPDQKIFLSVADAEPTNLDGTDAQALLICDHKHCKSVRGLFGATGSSMYAWFKSTDNQPISVLVG